MKKFAISAIVAVAVVVGATAHAASPQSRTFAVDIDLTTGCIISTAPTAVKFTYTAFGPAVNLDSNGSVGVTCTENLNYTLSLDGSGTYTDDATLLSYTLTLSATNKTGIGTEQTTNITGSMGANQAGKCAANGATCDNSASTNKTRTLTVSY